MTTALHLAKSDDLPKLSALVAAFHAESGIEMSDEARTNGLAPLLDGIPHGAAYLLGPARAPVGYVIVTFGWSVEFGGMDGFVDELYLRPAVRGRGIATEVLLALPKALAEAGMKAIHLEVAADNATAQSLYERTGFRTRDGYRLMTRVL